MKTAPSRHSLNGKLLLITALILGLGVPGVYFWHLRSVAALSSAILAQAESLVRNADKEDREGNPATAIEQRQQAVDLLWRYHEIHPEDGSAVLLLADTYATTPQGLRNLSRTAQLFFEAIRLAPPGEEADLRVRTADVLNRLGDYSQAQSVLMPMMPVWSLDEPLGASATKWLAMSLAGQMRTRIAPDPQQVTQELGAPVGEIIRRAASRNPADPQLAVNLAMMFRDPAWRPYLGDEQKQDAEGLPLDEQGFLQAADQVVDEFVERTKTHQAYFSRYQYRVALPDSFSQTQLEADLNEAWRCVDKAWAAAKEPSLISLEDRFRLESEFAAIAFYQGVTAFARANREDADSRDATLQEAIGFLQTSIQHVPQIAESHMRLGEALLQSGKTAEAIEAWRVGLNETSDESLRVQLISALITLGADDPAQLKDAKDELNKLGGFVNRVSRSAATQPEVYKRFRRSYRYLDARLLYFLGDYGSAIDKTRDLIASEDEATARSAARQLLGEILLRINAPQLAADSLSLAADEDPNQERVRADAFRAYLACQNYDEAAEVYRRILAENDTANNWLEYASVLYQREADKPRSTRDWTQFEIALNQVDRNELEPVDHWKLSALTVSARMAKGGDRFAAAGTSTSNATAQVDPQDDEAEMAQLLEELASQVGEEPDGLRELTLIHARRGDRDRVDQLLAKIAGIQEPDAPSYIFESEVHATLGNLDAAQAVLTKGLSQLPADQHVDLGLALSMLQLRDGETDAAVAGLQELTQKHPDRPDLLITLANLVIALELPITESDLATWEKSLLAVEGESGPHYLFLAAQSKLGLATDKTSTDTQERKLELLLEAGSLRRELDGHTRWPAVHSLAGRIFEAESLFAERKQAEELRRSAYDAYKRAIDQGDRRARVIVRMLALGTQDDFNEPAQYSLMLDPGLVASNPVLAGIQARALVLANQLDSAIDATEMSLRERPNDAIAWASKASLLLLKSSRESRQDLKLEADAAIKQATEFAPLGDDPLSAYVRVFGFYALEAQLFGDLSQRTAALQKAGELIPRIVELEEPSIRRFRRATLLSQIGDPAAAKEFLAAEAELPAGNTILTADQASQLERMVGYFANHNVADVNCLQAAIRITTRLRDYDPLNQVYRRQLAELLVMTGSEEDFARMEELFRLGESETLAIEDARLYAFLLVSRSNLTNSARRKNLDAAEERLSAAIENMTAAEHLLLGQIDRIRASLEKDDNAKRAWLEAAKSDFRNAYQDPALSEEQLATVARFFVAAAEIQAESSAYSAEETSQAWNEARGLADEVHSRSRDDDVPQSLPVFLHVRICDKGDQDKASAAEHIDRFATEVSRMANRLTPETRLRLFAEIASLYELVGGGVNDSLGRRMLDNADTYRQMAAQLDPNQIIARAFAHARNNDKSQAIKFCTDLYEGTKNLAAVFAISVILVSGETQESLMAQAEPVLGEALATYPNDIDLLMSIANVRLVCQDNPGEAIRLYEAALSLQEDNVTLLNNLATVYTEQDGMLDRASSTIERAIKIAGEIPQLQDTKAVIHMEQGDLSGARRILDEIVTHDCDPRYWWHLSEVLWKLYETSNDETLLRDAKHALQQAEKNELAKQILTPSEKQQLDRLRTNLKSDGSVALPAAGPIACRRWDSIRSLTSHLGSVKVV